MILTSKNNPLIKETASLKEKKGRKQLGLFLVEGLKMTLECQKSDLEIERVFLSESFTGDLPDFNAETVRVSDDVFRFLSDEKTPQGVLCRVKIPQNTLCAPKSSCLLLDGVADPGNVGAIVRTANAAGYTQLYLTEGCADPYSPKAVRASMSGIFFAKLRRKTKDETLKLLAGIPMIVADMKGENVFSFRPPEKFCLVIGNEANGVSDEVRAAAAYTVKIPMSAHSESLNAGVSLAVMLYELTAGKGLPLTGGVE